MFTGKVKAEKKLDDPLRRLFVLAQITWGEGLAAALPGEGAVGGAPIIAARAASPAAAAAVGYPHTATRSKEPPSPSGHGFTNKANPSDGEDIQRIGSGDSGSMATELRRTVFISHSRRDPGTLNATYALISALRSGHRADGAPFCRAVADGDATLWVDREQMKWLPGENWSSTLAVAQKYAVLNCFFLSNAFAGSDECMKELEYAELKKLNRCPIFLEPFITNETAFRSVALKCDDGLSTFQAWEANVAMIERSTYRLQGVPAFLAIDALKCKLCATTRDKPCPSCSSWEVACVRSPNIVTVAESLGAYIDVAFSNSGEATVKSETKSSADAIATKLPTKTFAPPAEDKGQLEKLASLDELSAFLAELKLADFEAALRDLGAEETTDLVGLEDSDYEEIGMKKLQKRKLQAAVAEVVAMTKAAASFNGPSVSAAALAMRVRKARSSQE